MCSRIAIVYNKPEVSRYSSRGEDTAVLGVLGLVAGLVGWLLHGVPGAVAGVAVGAIIFGGGMCGVTLLWLMMTDRGRTR